MNTAAPVVVAGPMAHRSERMARLVEMARRVARSDANILLWGESGTGKGRLARFLHETSPRSSGPFVTITCANIPGELLESELFGHEKGAFTGATDQRTGRFEQADGGTILIDGVHELAPALQGKLLRVVQEKTFERLAGTHTLTTDCRVLSSTQVDLAAMAEDGRFRQDLFYRLNVIRLELPPLRERMEDLPMLADEILGETALRTGSPVRRLAPAALDALMQHDWPGNVRELQNVLESAAIISDDALIPPDAIRLEAIGAGGPLAEATRQRWPLARLEKMYIREVLRLTRGNRSEAAGILGINRKTLLEKRKRYGIP